MGEGPEAVPRGRQINYLEKGPLIMTQAAHTRIKVAAVVLAVGSVSASADFVGLETETVDHGNGSISHRVFATFDGLNDRLLGAVGTPTVDMTILTDDPAGFFQIPPENLGADTAPSQALIDIFPDLVMDSWVTLGLDAGYVVADATLLTPGWFDDGVSDGFNMNGIIGPTDEGWVNSAPDNGQGDPDIDGRVLIGQFTVGEGFSVEGIDMTIGWIDLDLGGDTVLTETGFFSGDVVDVDAPLDAFQVVRGVLTGGDLTSLGASDDDYVNVTGQLNPQGTRWQAVVTVDAISPIDTASDLTVTGELAIDAGTTSGRIQMRVWSTNKFVNVAALDLTSADTVWQVSVNPDSFIQVGTGAIDIRLSTAAKVVDFPDNYELRIDHVSVVVTP